MLTKMRILVLWYQLKQIRKPFAQIKTIIIGRNPMDVDEGDEKTHKTPKDEYQLLKRLIL